MVMLTENAVMVIRDLSAQQGTPRTSGLRITSGPASGSLIFTMADEPAGDDQVVDNLGARLYLDPEAADMLADRALDATVDDEGLVHFDVSDRR